MNNIEEIKKLIIGELLGDGYPLEDATTQVDEAKDIIIENDIVKIIYKQFNIIFYIIFNYI